MTHVLTYRSNKIDCSSSPNGYPEHSENRILKPTSALVGSSNDNDMSERFHELGTPLAEPRTVETKVKEVLAQFSNSEKQDAYPCTPLQEGLMALSLKQPGKFMPQIVCKMPADLDVPRFKAAWQETVNSNSPLRTAISQTSTSGLVQIVLSSYRIDWKSSDCLQDYLKIDLEQAVLVDSVPFRYALLDDSSSGKKYFVWTFHHALVDGWSMRLLLNQVTQRYRGTSINPLVPFSRFIAYIAQLDRQKVDEFWRRQLSGINTIHFPALPSATYSPAPNCSTTRHIRIPSGLKALATTSTIIQAAWALLLRRYTSSNDVVSGLVLAGRDAPVSNIANVNGPTFATVPLRICIDPEQSVTAYLTAVRRLKSGIKPYQHAGLQNIRRLDPDCAVACNFGHLVVVQPVAETDTQSLFWDRDRLSDTLTRLNTYGLMLECAMTADGFTALANFDTATVSEEQMKQLLADLGFVISQFDSDSGTLVGDIKTHEGASHTLQTYIADTQAFDLSFPDLLDQQASRLWNSVAICSWDGELSYAELDHLSQQLAYRLRTSNVGPESMVPLLFEKSLWTIVAMMAVMKAGGAFVPLDPSHPKDRLKNIIQEIGAGLLLCSEKCIDLFPDTLFSEVIVVGRSSLSALPPTRLTLPAVRSNSSLYVIFTSGSTGKPKGCVVEHSACCSTMVQLVKSYGMDQNSRVLQFSSYGFDGCILEIFGTLLAGGCICVPSEETRLNSITGFICDQKVNFAFLTPSFSRILKPDSVSSLSTLIVGGEKVTREDIDRWFGKLRLFQAYGPTECCVMCVVNEVQDQSSMPNEMGRGVIGNFVVLDESEKIASPGNAGELCIGGPNLARGYLNDGEKTAAAFRNDLPGALGLDNLTKRLYKTGDLVKMRSDGMIEYLGRKDKQVKLRGQRVELGDVEHHLRQCLAGVEDLAVEVIVPADDVQNPILAAFLCLGDQSTGRASVEENFIAKDPLTPEMSTRVWDRLSSSLPRYMVPTLLIPLEAIPLSAAGKIDRRKLQSAAKTLTKEDLIAYSIDKREKSVPVTENEKQLCRLWARVLNIPGDIIGCNDSFVRLGGDSILAMKLVAASREEGLVLSVADVFRSPRLRDLAKVATLAEVLDRDDIPIPPFSLVGGADVYLQPDIISQCGVGVNEIEDLYPCTPFQEGIMVLSLRRPGAYVAQHSFELSPDLSEDLETFCSAWDAVVKANPILRTRIIHSETGLMQVVVDEPIQWVFDGNLNDYFRKSKEYRMGYGTPLARYAIVPTVRGRMDKYHFVWTTHHAIYDGWSLNLILKQVDQHYQALKSKHGEASTDSSKLPINFNTFIKALQRVDTQESDAFWRKQFIDGEPKTFPHSHSKILSSPTAVVKSTVHCVGRPDATMSTIIRAAWAVTISKYANSSDVVFGATLSGRSGPITEVESIVGPTSTTVPIRIILDPLNSVADFLQGIQNQALDMMPFEHRGLANIGRIDSKTLAACDFGNLLVIQPKPDADMDGNIMHRRHSESVHVGIFDTYPLTMECALEEEGLTVNAIYDPEVIEEALMNRICSQFQHTLCQLCICHDQDRIQDIQTINPEDRETLWRWNANLPDAVDSCIHSLIEQITLEDPNAQAICAWDGELSYGDLDLQSSRVAHHLRGMGVGPEVKVPLLFNKSKWFVVAILGVLKAGGTFAPLEPSHPSARLASIVDQLKADILVCSPGNSDRCTTFPGCRLFVLDDSSFAKLAENDIAPYVEITPGDAAYVVFTSGTTGIPKGIVIEHRQYCSGAKEHSKALRFDRKSRHLQFASHSFDTGIEDILTTLLTGGCICIPSEEERNSDIVGAINRLNVTKADLTPSFLNNIEPREVPSLKVLILGGEPLTRNTIKNWASHVRLINAYGTSECSVTNTANTDINLDTDATNIGRAVGGTCWIVDAADHDKLAPIGTIGELVIEGPALGRGYLNDESSTSAAFINTPAWAREENGVHRPQRIYNTGDLAQYNSDGSICYRGRKDNQVKVRGQRVELYEVEKHLMDHPDVESAIALVPDSGPCAKTLTAVVQARVTMNSVNLKDMEIVTDARLKQIGFQWSELSAYLHERVPVYMIPTKWVALEKIPLHITKKLDRSKVMAWLSCLSEQQHVGRVTNGDASPLSVDETVAMELSHKIAELVSDDSIAGHNATISSVGVDSIRIVSLAAFVKRQFAVSIPMQTLIGSQVNIRDISRLIAEAKAGVEPRLLNQLDLMDEVSLLESQLICFHRPQHHLDNVFLTGANGLLGTQILRQLLHRPDVGKVTVHVRAESVELAKRRVMNSAQAAGWPLDAFSSKLEVWIGDLAHPRLGLTFQQWDSLASFDAIIHNGAAMKWNADYQALKPANVMSTMELLSILSLSRYSHRSPKFVYVSGGRDFGDEVSDEEAARMLAPVEGYSQTKFVSELLVKNFKKSPQGRGLDISIVKPALIIGTVAEGVANENDFLWRFVAGAVNVGGFPTPQSGHDWLMVSSADRVAAAVIQRLVAGDEDERSARIINIADGVPLPEFWTMVENTLGSELRPMEYDDWMQRLQKDIQTKKEGHPLWPVMHLLNRSSLVSKRPKQDDVLREGMDLVRAAIPTNVHYLINRGFLQRPGKVSDLA